ncbi:MAG: hypothetical protein ACRDQD_12440 [Nocardioidaceae bacterium]
MTETQYEHSDAVSGQPDDTSVEGRDGEFDPAVEDIGSMPVGEMVKAGHESRYARTRNVAKRVEADLRDLRERVAGEAQLAALEAQVSRQRQALTGRGGDDPADVDG